MKGQNKLLLCWMALLLAMFGILGAMGFWPSRTVPTDGVTALADLEIYEFDGETIQTRLPWGTVGNGTYTNQSIVENKGNVPVTLSMETDETYEWLDLTWNYTGYVIEPEAQVGIEWTLTLTNAPKNTTFAFNIVVTGTEV